MIVPREAADIHLAAWQFTSPISPKLHRSLRTEMALSGFKWDSQVGDICTLAPFAVVLPVRVWENVRGLAAQLARELELIEQELVGKPAWWRSLGLPRPVLSALSTEAPWTPAAARVMRFDFHPTTEGWKISEVNSDVPGGFTEASRLTQRMAELTGNNTAPAGDPTQSLCDALGHAAKQQGRVALLCAPGYIEDQQVIAHIADALKRRGLETMIGTPEDVEWINGVAHLRGENSATPIDAIYRFYQGEWLSRLPAKNWIPFFRGGLTSVCNPGAAVLSESKRLPLLWDDLEAPSQIWRTLLPETKLAWTAFWHARKPILLKAAYSNTGDAVFARSWSRSGYALALARATLRPRSWLVQEMFQPLILKTPIGPAHICIGVYVIDGKVSGIYGRLSANELIDYNAIDIAVLVQN